MPYGGSDQNTDSEFYKEVARLLNVTPETVKRYWQDGFYEVLIRWLHFKGVVRLPHLGVFRTVLYKETYQNQVDSNGQNVTYKVPQREMPKFVAHDDFINDLNFMGVTKSYRRRLKSHQLSLNDFRREQRIAEFGEIGAIGEERMDIIKNRFKEKLEGIKEEARTHKCPT